MIPSHSAKQQPEAEQNRGRSLEKDALPMSNRPICNISGSSLVNELKKGGVHASLNKIACAFNQVALPDTAKREVVDNAEGYMGAISIGSNIR